MKKCSLIILLLFTVFFSFSQHVVTKVIGKVKKADGTFVRIGTKLSENELLTFSSKEDKMRIIIPGKGVFTVSPGSKAVKKENVWTVTLSKTIKTKTSSATLSSRGQWNEKIPEAFQTTVKINPLTLISNNQANKYLFNPSDYDITSGSRFVLQIEQKNETPSLQILRTSADTLFIYRSDLQTSAGAEKMITYTIGFYDKTKNKTSKVAEIKPYFDDAGEMEAIINTLVTENKNISKDTLRELCYTEVYKTLGKPSYTLYNSLFDTIFEEFRNPVSVNKKFKRGLTNESELYEKTSRLKWLETRDQTELPAQFSLKQYTPRVQSQGHFGTCVAWSTAYAARTIAWSVKNKFNNIDNASSILKYSFSPQFLYLNIKSPDDTKCEQGTNLVLALEFMKEKGVITWDNSTYDCSTAFSDNDVKNAETYKIEGFERLSSWFSIQDSTILDMKRAISEKKPLIIGMHLPNSFNYVDRRTGIWYPEPADYIEVEKVKNKKATYDGHAMCVIGYNDNKSINGGSFEIMNSWGEDAGKNGFYWISYDDMKTFASQVLIIEDAETK